MDKPQKDQKISETEVCLAVCPDSEETVRIHDTSPANPEGMQIQFGNGKT